MRNAETMQLKFLLIIHVAMGEVAPTRLVATAGRTRASRADAALDRLAAEHLEVEVDTDTFADSDDGNEALDALGKNERDKRAENAKRGRVVKKIVREKLLPTSCPAVLPDDVAITWGERMNESDVTVGEARAITFSRPLLRSGRAAAEVSHMYRERSEKVRSATLYRHSLHMKVAWDNMLAANSRHASAIMCIKWDETQQHVGIGSEAVDPQGACEMVGGLQ